MAIISYNRTYKLPSWTKARPPDPVSEEEAAMFLVTLKEIVQSQEQRLQTLEATMEKLMEVLGKTVTVLEKRRD